MEQAFIQACLAHCLYPDRPLPTPPLDLEWDKVYDLLLQHRLAGLFYVLGTAHPGLWPPQLQGRIQGGRYTALLRGDRCARQVNTVLSALHQASIPVMVLKGWALIPTVYRGDYGQRAAEDIDLLVLPQDAARAEGILHDLGYRGLTAEPWAGHHRRYSNGQAYLLPRDATSFGRGFLVGLHWQLLDTPFHFRHMPVGRFFERAQPLHVAGVDVCAPSAEDHLVYACGHLALHHSYDHALFRYYEMAALILQAAPTFDWAKVAARACTWRLVMPVQHVIAHLDTLWPGTVPPQALASLAALQPTRPERWVHRWVVARRRNPTSDMLLSMVTMPGLTRRVRFLLEQAFPSPAYMRQRYCRQRPGLWPLAYLQRAGLGLRYLLQRLG